MTTTSGRKSTYCFVVLNIPIKYLTTLITHHCTYHFARHCTRQNFHQYDQCYQECLQWRIQLKYLHFWKRFWYHHVILEQPKIFQPKLWPRLNSLDRARKFLIIIMSYLGTRGTGRVVLGNQNYFEKVSFGRLTGSCVHCCIWQSQLFASFRSSRFVKVWTRIWNWLFIFCLFWSNRFNLPCY